KGLGTFTTPSSYKHCDPKDANPPIKLWLPVVTLYHRFDFAPTADYAPPWSQRDQMFVARMLDVNARPVGTECLSLISYMRIHITICIPINIASLRDAVPSSTSFSTNIASLQDANP